MVEVINKLQGDQIKAQIRKRKIKKPVPITPQIISGTTCIHSTYDFGTGKLSEMCGQPVEQCTGGNYVYGTQHRFLCIDHEHEVHYMRRRVH